MSVASGSRRRVHAFAYSAVTTAIVLLFALAEWGTERFVSERSRAATTAIEIAIVLLAALAFRPLHRWAENAVESAFTRRKRQAIESLARFRRELTSFNDLRQLLRRVIEAVDQYTDIRASAVLLRRDAFKAEASSFDAAIAAVAIDDPLVVRLRSTGIPAKPFQFNANLAGSHAYPMTASGDLVGVLLVLCDHDEHDAEEVQMLSGLATDLAVAAIGLDPSLRPRAAMAPNNLPARPPALVGREREIGEIEAALRTARILTLTGAGGVGKTSVALRCAADEVNAREHGAWFVGLAPIEDGALVASTILSALDAATGEGDDADRLVDHLRARDLLLVLDNCEQVVEATAALAARIRTACPEVTLLVTSRELLRVEGEQVYRLGSLRTEAATELFARRAAAVSPDFDPTPRADVIRTICERLDGIPLAIELAAARVRALSVDDIAARLHERFRLLTSVDRASLPRQQTLAALIQWSYDLLSAQEQSILRRLCVFRGSFQLQAAAAICGDEHGCDEYHVLDVLTSLADKSLLTVRIGLATRYQLLETIREFAAQKAEEAQEAPATAERHAAHFAAVAVQAYHQFDSRPPRGWLDGLEPDLDNFRAALEWTLEGEGDRRLGAAMAADCGPMFLRLGLLSEGLQWCEAARQVGDLPPQVAARIDYVASMMLNNSQSFRAALECAQRAVQHFRASDDERGLIRALSQTAHQFARIRSFEEARAPAAEAVERARVLGEPRVLVAVLRRCAISLPPDEIERARPLFDEALRAARRAQDPEETGFVLQWWAIAEAASGSFDRAMELAAEALGYADADTQVFIESDAAGYALASGDAARAAAHAQRALSLSTGDQHPALSALAMAYSAPEMARRAPRDGALLLGFARAWLERLEFEGDHSERTALRNAAAVVGEAVGDPRETERLYEQGASLDKDEALRLLAEAPTSALGVA